MTKNAVPATPSVRGPIPVTADSEPLASCLMKNSAQYFNLDDLGYVEEE